MNTEDELREKCPQCGRVVFVTMTDRICITPGCRWHKPRERA